jgi:hypothetical protein
MAKYLPNEAAVAKARKRIYAAHDLLQFSRQEVRVGTDPEKDAVVTPETISAL